MIKILNSISSFYYLFKRDSRIAIIESHFPSGSNTFAILQELERRKIKVAKYSLPVPGASWLGTKFSQLNFQFVISKHDIVINTTGFRKIRKKQKLIDFWHGIPLKSMLFMEENDKYNNLGRPHNMDFLVTGSKLESTLLASCMFVPFNRHKILGSPRLDFLKNGDKSILDFLIEKPKNISPKSKIGIFMPTFRSSDLREDDGLTNNNVFNFDEFDDFSFNTYLEEKDIFIILKKHPLDKRNFPNMSRILEVSTEKLISTGTDLYEVLNSTNFLITDYSSIMYDYMILNKSIITLNPDGAEYSKTRGFLMNPENRLTGLDLISNETDLIKTITQELHQDFNKNFKNVLIHEKLDNITISVVDWLETLL